MAGIILMTIIAVLIAWLRMYTRAIVSYNVGWDDWIMFAVSVCTLHLPYPRSKASANPRIARDYRDRCLPYQRIPPGSGATCLLCTPEQRSGDVQMALGRRANQFVRGIPCSTLYSSFLPSAGSSQETLHLDHLDHHWHSRCL